MSCTQFKTLSISFTPPAITPAQGYFVRWRVVGETAWNTVPNQFNSPIVISNVPACETVEGIIQAACGEDNFGPEIPFVAQPINNCWKYQIMADGDATFTPCDSDEPVTISFLNGSVLCAKRRTVSGQPHVSLGYCE